MNAADGILTLNVAGKPTQPELAAAQKQKANSQQGKMSIPCPDGGIQGGRARRLGRPHFRWKMTHYLEKTRHRGREAMGGFGLIFASKGLRQFPGYSADGVEPGRAVDRQALHRTSLKQECSREKSTDQRK